MPLIFESMPELAVKFNKQVNDGMTVKERHEEAVFIALERYKELKKDLEALKMELKR